MSKEELLQPRVIVMVDFPQWSSFTHKEGDILVKKGIHYVGKGTARSINEKDVSKYPKVLQKLEWWEFRDEDDMPQYIRYGEFNKRHSIYKIVDLNPEGYEDYFPCAFAENQNVKDYFLATFHGSYPSDEQEYLKYNAAELKSVSSR
jgi:hypothetical protein